MADKPSKSTQLKTTKGRSSGKKSREAGPGLSDRCIQCQRPVSRSVALFVEVEVGRMFCSEKCIMEHFSPEVDRLEAEYLRRVPADDLSVEERDDLNHLRWMVMENPHEVWREKTLDGDHKHTLISQFDYNSQKIWCACLTLFIESGPSFIYLSFVTRKPELVELYRRGELVGKMANRDKGFGIQVGGRSSISLSDEESKALSHEPTDRLADPWTEDETFRAGLAVERSEQDIPYEEFEDFDDCIEPTLREPDEVWRTVPGESKGADKGLYHFIREFSDLDPQTWFIVVARETENDEEIEIMDAFPTIDLKLVERYRVGKQESAPNVEKTVEKRTLH